LRCQCKLNFVGDGPLAFSLQKAIDRLQLNDRVQLERHSHDVLQLMRESTVLVLASRWEGMPNVVLEAMANALPVVATSIDGIRELIDDGTTGWLVPAATPAALAERIATAKVSQHFSWASAIERYDQLLRNLLANRPADHAAKKRI
jgi:glycosyltransferase involved in cell wall biosynthesis